MSQNILFVSSIQATVAGMNNTMFVYGLLVRPVRVRKIIMGFVIPPPKNVDVLRW